MSEICEIGEQGVSIVGYELLVRLSSPKTFQSYNWIFNQIDELPTAKTAFGCE